MPHPSHPAQRRKRAAESFATAAEAIGPVGPGSSVFCLNRGQWSMIDAVLHCLDCIGPAFLTLWTWTVAEYEVEVLQRLQRDDRLTGGRLIIDAGARTKNLHIIREWQKDYGPESVRYVLNHAKIATMETPDGLRVLCRGSMNLNHNPRFEQFDLTTNGPDFDLIRDVEEELPILADDCSGEEVYAATKLGKSFSPQQLNLFEHKGKTWRK